MIQFAYTACKYSEQYSAREYFLEMRNGTASMSANASLCIIKGTIKKSSSAPSL